MVLDTFWGYFVAFWVIILATFSDTVKNGRPYESAVNSSRIEGRAPRKTMKKNVNKTMKKGVPESVPNLDGIWKLFGTILSSERNPNSKESQGKNRRKFPGATKVV